jgi:hypothetical protein
MSCELPPQKVRKPLDDDFDRTDELWERITDDLMTGKAPCLDTVAELVEESSYLDPKSKG